MILCPQMGQHKLIEVRKATQNTLLNFAPTKQHEIIFGITPVFWKSIFLGIFSSKSFKKFDNYVSCRCCLGFCHFIAMCVKRGQKETPIATLEVKFLISSDWAVAHIILVKYYFWKKSLFREISRLLIMFAAR